MTVLETYSNSVVELIILITDDRKEELILN